MKERIWLTWETQRRNRTLSAALGADLYELDYRLPRPLRWAKAGLGTLRILLRERPRLVLAQNPSLVLALLAVWYGRLSGRTCVIDAHNGGLFPLADRGSAWRRPLVWLLARLVRHVIRLADVTLVSNPALVRHIDAQGGRGFALPDPLPQFPETAAAPLAGEGAVLFICTWAADEPYLEVLRAAASLPRGVRVYITGNSKGREAALGTPLPENVELTGFVSEARFVELLHSADVIMDLTTRENCLVCGAYEAVAAGKPMVLSDTQALRQYFSKGAVYTGNTATELAGAMQQALAERGSLGRACQRLRQELHADWERRRGELERLLQQPGGRALRPQPAADKAGL